MTLRRKRRKVADGKLTTKVVESFENGIKLSHHTITAANRQHHETRTNADQLRELLFKGAISQDEFDDSLARLLPTEGTQLESKREDIEVIDGQIRRVNVDIYKDEMEGQKKIVKRKRKSVRDVPIGHEQMHDPHSVWGSVMDSQPQPIREYVKPGQPVIKPKLTVVNGELYLRAITCFVRSDGQYISAAEQLADDYYLMSGVLCAEHAAPIRMERKAGKVRYYCTRNNHPTRRAEDFNVRDPQPLYEWLAQNSVGVEPMESADKRYWWDVNE